MNEKWLFPRKKAQALMDLAGIPYTEMYELINQYWPRTDTRYYETLIKSPWWLVQTPAGLIRIGWRKRVIAICWQNTDIRCVVTDDEVTKDYTMVHAWGEEKALEYLKTLSQYMDSSKGLLES
ncbi:MAG: hypothetical protein AAGM67_05165 [Bacteroidota bacterium]